MRLIPLLLALAGCAAFTHCTTDTAPPSVTTTTSTTLPALEQRG